MKNQKEYLIDASIVVERDCLLLLGMIANYSTLDIAMLRQIAYIKSMDVKFKSIAEKDNVVANMLSWVRYIDRKDMIEDEEDVKTNFYTSPLSK